MFNSARSELAFRMLVRKYNAQLCYTPMINARLFVTDKTYRASHFQTTSGDRPLIAQLCGHDERQLEDAARLLVGQVDAIDLNLGCPENIAKKGGYGSFLLQNPDAVLRIVRHLIQSQVSIFDRIC